MNLQITIEWKQLRHAVDKLESELASSSFPLPSPEMCEFLIRGEDRRFHYHPGVDPVALCRAAWKTVFCGSRQGASTIAMQLVRTISGRYEKTWRRKVREIILAFGLTQYISKDRLPVMYLWIAYYGSGMINFKQACTRLHIDPHCIDSFEAAKLPWLAPLFKAIELPGGVKVEFAELEKAQRDAQFAGILGGTL